VRSSWDTTARNSSFARLTACASDYGAAGLQETLATLAAAGGGDFIDDYEGIGGCDDFRDDLVLMYFPTVDCRTASPAEAEWLRARLSDISDAFGSRIDAATDGGLVLRWKNDNMPPHSRRP